MTSLRADDVAPREAFHQAIDAIAQETALPVLIVLAVAILLVILLWAYDALEDA